MMIDHSNQIGAEKVMLALGVNAAAMPEPGKALTHEDVRVLDVKPGDSWKTADMEREYELEHGTSKELARRLIDFVAESEEPLREGERLPMSTEILESSFGLYKQLERQQSMSGFTSLLACLPALLKPTTPERVMNAFARTSAEDVNAWTREHFPSTITSRRHAAYAEHRSALNRATTEAVAT